MLFKRRLPQFLVLLYSAGLMAQEPDPSRRLEDAIRCFLEGSHEEARSRITKLLNDESVVDPELRKRARVFLGEVLFVEGKTDAAWDAFSAILAEDPHYRLDPYEHPPDVVDFYETVRATTIAMAPSDATTHDQADDLAGRPPAFFTTLLPFGYYHFRTDRPALGSMILTGQVAAATWSLSEYIYLRQHREIYSNEHDARESWQTRFWAQQVATGVFYGIWAASMASAWTNWTRQDGTLGIAPMVAPNGTGIGIYGTLGKKKGGGSSR